MKVADYIIHFLRQMGVDTLFQVYGAATADLIDACPREGMRYICVLHEQAGVFAAEVQAKLDRKPAVFIATSGPGGTNTLTGVANCYYDSVPALIITGNIHAQFFRKDPAVRQIGFQENDIVAMAAPITKWAFMCREPGEVKGALAKAWNLCQEDRKGPVLLDIPVDLMKKEIDPQLTGHDVTNSAEGYKLNPWREQIAEFVRDFKQAKRPVLIAGGGCWWGHAEELVRELGERLQVPCLPTWNAIDIFTSDFPLYRGRIGTFGGPGRNFAVQNADLLLSIGCRMSGRITGGYVSSFARAAKKYIVDLDEALLNPAWQEVKGDVNILQPASTFITELLHQLRGQVLPDRTWWLTKTAEWRDKYQPCLPHYYNTTYIHPYVFIKMLSEHLKPEDTVVVDCGGNVVVAYQALETKWGQRILSSHGNSPMGFSFAGAMGAPFAERGKKGRIVCLIGDGGMNMNIQELQTLVNCNLPVRTFVINNHSYGITRQFQLTNYQGRYLASCAPDYSPPDFCKVAEAYRVPAIRVKSLKRLDEAIDWTLEAPGPVVCDVDCGMHDVYEPRIFGWKTPIEDMYPYLSREEFRANMLIDPVEGWEHPAVPGAGPGTGLA